MSRALSDSQNPCHSESGAKPTEEPAAGAAPANSPLARPAFPFLPNLPERTHPKPRKRHCETNCNYDATKSGLSGLAFRILVRHTCAATCSHQHENKADNLQPQLMQHLSEGAGR